MVPGDGTEVLQRYGGYTYEQGELRGRVGRERGGKETDGVMFHIILTSETLLMNQHPL
jgi:hypothetical protein